MDVLTAAAPRDGLDAPARRFFPGVDDPAPRLRHEDVRWLLTAPSPFYARLCEALAARWSRASGLDRRAALLLAREPVVLLTHLFLDRLLRLARLRARGPAAVARARDYPDPEGVGAFVRAASSSAPFNARLLAELAPVFGLALSDAPAPRPPAAAPAAAAQNLNFDRPGLLRRAAWKAARVSSRALGRVPALGLAYAQAAFLDAGLIGPGGLADLHGAADFSAPRSQALRRDVLDASLADVAADFGRLLAEGGLEPADRDRAATLFHSWFVRLYPAERFEAAAQALPACAARLARFRGKPLLFSETGTSHTAFMLAAARSLGMPLVGVQHGAHYGFSLTPCHVELEWAYCDRFVTWGWTGMPDHPLCRGVETVPLPSPWLSERARRWRSLPRAAPIRDLLLVTDRIQDFPPPVSTIRMSRPDYLPELAGLLESAVDALCGAGLSVLHKPFNAASAALQAPSLAALAARHGARYAVHDRLDKGLSEDVLASCKAVVWDEPGSGFFETLAGGIPTLLFWPRRFSSETAAAAPLFAALEAARVAHRTPETLARAAAELARDPGSWAAEPGRARACAAALHALARTDPDWAAPWRRFIRSL